jgi:Bcr/CflA subfamily drug resistance transporter
MSKNLNTASNRLRHFWAIIPLLIIPITGLSVDIYIPSLPAMSHFFHVDKSLIQLTITFYMLGAGITQLFSGPISDSFGRKKPFLAGMFIFILTTFFVTLTKNIDLLLCLRLIQGIMVGILITPIRAIIPDLFSGKKMQQMMTYMTTAWSIGPIIAPVIGGYLQHYFDWQANFYFLLIYSLLMFGLVVFFLPETSVHRHDFKLQVIFRNYKEILSSPEYLRNVFSNGLLYSIILLFAVISPFLIQNVLHFSTVQYGHITLFIGLAWFLGSIINRFTFHFNFAKKNQCCLWLMLIINSVMLLLSLIMPVNIYSLMIPLFCLVLVGGIVFSGYFPQAISLFPTKTGSAGSLIGACVFFIAGGISALGTFLKSTSQTPLTLAYLVLIGICLILSYTIVGKPPTLSKK